MTRPEEASEPDERLDQDMRKDDERQRNECREETKGTGEGCRVGLGRRTEVVSNRPTVVRLVSSFRHSSLHIISNRFNIYYL